MLYLDIHEDTIKVFPMRVEDGKKDVSPEPISVLTEHSVSSDKPRHYFYNPSFDIDVLTLPLKFRFRTETVPQQLTSNINGNVYLGFRNDIYRVGYKQNPLKETHRSIQHIGTSVGAFFGISSEPVNPWVTNDHVTIEYDGFLLSTGFAWIAGFNKLTIGFSLGFDYLLDQNRTYYVYQGKPYVGLAFGINLN